MPNSGSKMGRSHPILIHRLHVAASSVQEPQGLQLAGRRSGVTRGHSFGVDHVQVHRQALQEAEHLNVPFLGGILARRREVAAGGVEKLQNVHMAVLGRSVSWSPSSST